MLGASVTTLNVLADPYGYAGSGLFATAILSDRPIKACLIERLPHSPSVMILGSSRAEKIQPSQLQRRTGLAGFNAAVSSGTPDDAWAFANLLHERAGGAQQRVLWLLDVESMRRHPVDPGLLDTPSLAQLLDKLDRAQRPCAESLVVRLLAHRGRQLEERQRDPLRDRASALQRTCSIHTNGVTEYARDGYRSFDFHDVAVRRGMSLARSIGITLAEYRTDLPGGYPPVCVRGAPLRADRRRR